MQAAHEAALLQAAACLEQQQHRCTQLEEAAAQSSGTAVQLHEQLQAAQTEHADALKQAALRHAEVSKDAGDLEIVSFAGVTVLMLPALSASSVCHQSFACQRQLSRTAAWSTFKDTAAESLSRQLRLESAGNCWPEEQAGCSTKHRGPAAKRVSSLSEVQKTAGSHAAASRTELLRGFDDCSHLHLQEVDLLKVRLADARAQVGRDQQQLRQLERQLSRIRTQQDKLRFQELQVCPSACHSPSACHFGEIGQCFCTGV